MANEHALAALVLVFAQYIRSSHQMSSGNGKSSKDSGDNDAPGIGSDPRPSSSKTSTPSAPTERSTITSGTSAEETASRASQLLESAEECISGSINEAEMVRRFKAFGASPFETNAYLKLVADRKKGTGDSRPAGLGKETIHDDDEDSDSDEKNAARLAEIRDYQSKVAEETAWAAIFGKVDENHTDSSRNIDPQVDLSSLLRGLREPSHGLSRAVLTGAPHLASLGAPTGDPILDETTRLKDLFSNEKAVDGIVAKLRSQPSHDAVPQSICKDIVNDKYVDFAKLHASLEPSYNHDDDIKDLAVGEDTYSVVKKDNVSRSKPVLSESHWTRLFDAWESAVVLVYPHRKEELSCYRRFIIELFQSMPNDPSMGIRVDQNVRFDYSKNPFRMDNENRFNRIALRHIRSTASSSSPSSGPSKRSSSSSIQRPQKRNTTICDNWNSNRCSSDPCDHQRIHGRCSECDQGHRAFDNAGCKASFEARKGT